MSEVKNTPDEPAVLVEDASEILRLIKNIDLENTAALDEIDARVHNYSRGHKFVRFFPKKKNARAYYRYKLGKETYGLSMRNIPKISRNPDAQKIIEGIIQVE